MANLDGPRLENDGVLRRPIRRKGVPNNVKVTLVSPGLPLTDASFGSNSTRMLASLQHDGDGGFLRRVDVADHCAQVNWTAGSRKSRSRASERPKTACFGGKTAVELKTLPSTTIWPSRKPVCGVPRTSVESGD